MKTHHPHTPQNLGSSCLLCSVSRYLPCWSFCWLSLLHTLCPRTWASSLLPSETSLRYQLKHQGFQFLSLSFVWVTISVWVRRFLYSTVVPGTLDQIHCAGLPRHWKPANIILNFITLCCFTILFVMYSCSFRFFWIPHSLSRNNIYQKFSDIKKLLICFGCVWDRGFFTLRYTFRP